MSTSFHSYVPASGKRQPRIVYDINDPRVAVIERLRDVFGYRSMNDAYLTALALGANMILQKEDPLLVVRKFTELKPGRRPGAVRRPKTESSEKSEDQGLPPRAASVASVSPPSFEIGQAAKGPPDVIPSLRGFAARSGSLPGETIYRAERPASIVQPPAAAPAVASLKPGASRLAMHHFGLYGGNDLDDDQTSTG